MSESARQLRVSDYMTTVPHSIEPHQDLDDAWHMMGKYHVRHLPVLAGGHLVGLLSERDLTYLRQISNKKEELRVRDAMVYDPVVVGPEESLRDVARRMAADRIGSVLICDARQKLLGIFTYVDALAALSDIA